MRNKNKAKRNARILTAGVWSLIGGSILGLYLINKAPDMNKKRVKENTVQIQEKQILDKGIVVCSNQNLLYAQLNHDTLQKEGYENSYLQKVKVKGDIFYRTVVGTTKENLEDKLKELRKKDYFGTADQFFVIKGKDVSSLSKETKAEKQKRVTQMENEFKSNVQKTQKDEYVKLMRPFIDKTYSIYTGKELRDKKINEIAGYMYNAAKEFNVPLVDYTALIANESKFTNDKGDEWSKTNYSEGYIQMRKETQKFVFGLMKRAGIPNLPDKLPESIISSPKLQFRMGAFYFRYCLDKANGGVEQAINKYNMGHNSEKQNEKYKKRVIEQREKINDHMLQAI